MENKKIIIKKMRMLEKMSLKQKKKAEMSIVKEDPLALEKQA
jgi:hypothetical protein